MPNVTHGITEHLFRVYAEQRGIDLADTTLGLQAYAPKGCIFTATDEHHVNIDDCESWGEACDFIGTIEPCNIPDCDCCTA